MDPNVAKMIERSRNRTSAKKASRIANEQPPRAGKLSPRKIDIVSEERSPLKPRNFDGIRSGGGGKSPKKMAEIPDSPSDTIKRILSRESLETNVQDLLARDSPGKSIKSRTTVTTSTSSPSRKTVTKTIVTETEEKYERKEVISYSGNKEFIKDYESGKIQKEVRGLDKENQETERNIPIASEKVDSSSSRFENRRMFSPAKPAAEVPAPEDTDYFAQRKARLANLANRFKNMEDDPRHVDVAHGTRTPNRSPIKTNPNVSPSKEASPLKPPVSFRSVSPTKSSASLASSVNSASRRDLSPTKNTTAKPYSPASPTRRYSPVKATARSPVRAPIPPAPKPPVDADESLMSSLKAQGFAVSESASKLVYKFEKRSRSPSPVKSQIGQGKAMRVQETRGRSPVKSTVRASPTKNVCAPRSVSPSKPHPLQFVSPQVAAQAASVVPAPPPKPISPTKNVVPRSVSPSKPHPLQFISPQVAAEAAKLAAPPPKPSRTYEASSKPELIVTKPQIEADDRCDTPVRRSVHQKRAMWENQTPEREAVDPAMMSLSQRKAMFEKNKSVPTPIARFGESVTPAMLAKKPATETMTPAEAWKRKRELSPNKMQPPTKKHSPENYVTSACKPKLNAGSAVKQVMEQSRSVEPTPVTPLVGRKANELHKKLFEKKDWRDNEIARARDEEKQKDMDLLLNRYNHLKSSTQGEFTPPPVAPKPKRQEKQESPERYYPGVNSLKKVKVSPPKAGSLYPELAYETDTMSSRPDSVMSSDTMNTSDESIMTTNSEAPSLGKDIVAASRKSTVTEPNLAPIQENNDSMDTEDGEELSESAVNDEIDDMLEEAMDDSADSEHFSPHHHKGSESSSGSSQVGRSESTTSWEFHTPQPKSKREVSPSRYKTPLVLARESPSKVPQVQLEGVEGPIMHTVSFYRKQRTAVTPVQRIVLNPVLEQSIVSHQESPRTTISQKIKILQDEANSQMSVISQASSALNLCRATKEFYGSQEQVEGERLLLVATHKRTAALNEISKLKTEGGLGAEPGTDNSVRGTVSLNSISLALKKEFVHQLRSGEMDTFVHYFLCLVKCGGQVIPTQMVSTLDGLDSVNLDFPNLIKLTELPKNFAIQMEVYGLQTKREVFDHDAKYHIRKEKSLFSLTPKLRMNRESRLTRPDTSSPGGPHTVRSSSFAMVGNTSITLGNLGRKEWRLENVPAVSPLDGALTFQLNCHSESQVRYRGFLTMFDDVSGFGAWHRRWFVLEGNRLSFWKYPDNQKTEEPIGSIDLGGCITESVSIAPRDICSRMHTFLLESRRPARSGDRASLILVREGSNTIIRHLLSADSREERLTWCSLLNQALDNLRAWDPHTHQHKSDSVSSADSNATSTSTEIW